MDKNRLASTTTTAAARPPAKLPPPPLLFAPRHRFHPAAPRSPFIRLIRGHTCASVRLRKRRVRARARLRPLLPGAPFFCPPLRRRAGWRAAGERVSERVQPGSTFSALAPALTGAASGETETQTWRHWQGPPRGLATGAGAAPRPRGRARLPPASPAHSAHCWPLVSSGPAGRRSMLISAVCRPVSLAGEKKWPPASVVDRHTAGLGRDCGAPPSCCSPSPAARSTRAHVASVSGRAGARQQVDWFLHFSRLLATQPSSLSPAGFQAGFPAGFQTGRLM